jgi:hypothetical protein
MKSVQLLFWRPRVAKWTMCLVAHVIILLACRAVYHDAKAAYVGRSKGAAARTGSLVSYSNTYSIES